MRNGISKVELFLRLSEKARTDNCFFNSRNGKNLDIPEINRLDIAVASPTSKVIFYIDEIRVESQKRF